ncbi:MAG: class I SAM-dependent methyltransferase [Bacteroidetes bacterium]|nr:class I SAM-dependent methyltransferase [Bacteroidota bacterium]
MKTRNPKSKFDLKIKSSDRVLEVGGGHNPHPRANVVVDKFVDSNFHRSGDIKVLKNQTFMQADGEALPFKDNEFDYIICCQVLEHVENPVKFLSEQFRVAKRGYLETPSLIGEYLFPRISHKWILHELDDVLYLLDKKKLGFTYGYDMTELIQDFLPTHSIGFKIMERTHPNMITVRIEWEKDFKYVVEPEDPEIRKYFSGKWDINWADRFFPKKTMMQEFKDASAAFADISKSVFKSKVLKKH